MSSPKEIRNLGLIEIIKAKKFRRCNRRNK